MTNIPQHRERIYIICFKDFKDFDFNFNINYINKSPISQFLENNVPLKYYYNNLKNDIHIKIINSVKNSNSVYQYRRTFVRENKSNECPTLTANMGQGGHNVPIILDINNIPRKLTPRECFNLQGFPKEYIIPDNLCDSKLYKLIGNAVTYPIILHISKQILNHLND